MGIKDKVRDVGLILPQSKESDQEKSLWDDTVAMLKTSLSGYWNALLDI